MDTEITAKPSAIIIGSVDPTVWKDTLAAAKAAGIPVLAADTAIADPYISALVQTDNLTSAQNLGAYICKLLNGAKQTLEQADWIIGVFDGSAPSTPEDRQVIGLSAAARETAPV